MDSDEVGRFFWETV